MASYDSLYITPAPDWLVWYLLVNGTTTRMTVLADGLKAGHHKPALYDAFRKAGIKAITVDTKDPAARGRGSHGKIIYWSLDGVLPDGVQGANELT